MEEGSGGDACDIGGAMPPVEISRPRRPFMTQKSTIASRKQQAVCVRRAYKNYGPKNNPNVILDGLNMTVAKGWM